MKRKSKQTTPIPLKTRKIAHCQPCVYSQAIRGRTAAAQTDRDLADFETLFCLSSDPASRLRSTSSIGRFLPFTALQNQSNKMAFGTPSSRRMPPGLVVLFTIKWIQFMIAIAVFMYIFVLPAEIVKDKFTAPSNHSKFRSDLFPESESVVYYKIAVLRWVDRFCPSGDPPSCRHPAQLITPATFSSIGLLFIIWAAYRIVEADHVWNEKRYRIVAVLNLIAWIIVVVGLAFLRGALEITVGIFDSAFYTSLMVIAFCIVELIAAFLFETTTGYQPMSENAADGYTYANEVADWIEQNENIGSSPGTRQNIDVYRKSVA
ncbi:hypothetical protein QR680_007707 [Steinernema hermaphroditum]|uniref:Uncharacterized protein n=1 Tax=Steinernema hermaphroditum TaxID=289476 RepID=A0AA39IE06_9BILA|nr:hypothetical protein QR680_007707 [Steinernema hermaphroditum]